LAGRRVVCLFRVLSFEDKQMIREFVRKNLLELAKETLSGGRIAILRYFYGFQKV
jgi:hypothetical protein